MLLAYVDESHTRDRYYTVTLLVLDDQAITLTPTLDKAVAGAAQAHAVAPLAECYGTDPAARQP